ncbi:MAG TPA: hypothetical protein VGN72_22905 [Tepidisphaeraceae bacterium]|jgi:hypothetical protein|nr:hypothetical protein [Tepidisphaeraceae bacterium]
MQQQAPDSTSNDLIDYLMQHFGQFVSVDENHAFYRYVMYGPRDPGPPNPDDPEEPGRAVRQLLADGPVEFKRRIAERILREHGEAVFLNLCPGCGGLCRTPKALQCFRCER